MEIICVVIILRLCFYSLNNQNSICVDYSSITASGVPNETIGVVVNTVYVNIDCMASMPLWLFSPSVVIIEQVPKFNFGCLLGGRGCGSDQLHAIFSKCILN